MRVVRVRNPEAFKQPALDKLFAKTLAHDPIVDWEEAKPEVIAGASVDHVGIFVGAEKGKLAAVALVVLPQSRMYPVPQVPVFGSFGSAGLRNALIDTAVEFMVSNGYTQFMTANLTGKSDVVHQRAFKRAGEFERIGSLAIVKV